MRTSRAETARGEIKFGGAMAVAVGAPYYKKNPARRRQARAEGANTVNGFPDLKTPLVAFGGMANAQFARF